MDARRLECLHVDYLNITCKHTFALSFCVWTKPLERPKGKADMANSRIKKFIRRRLSSENINCVQEWKIERIINSGKLNENHNKVSH